MAAILDNASIVRIAGGIGFTADDVTNARNWHVARSGKSGRGVLADSTLLAWFDAGQPEVEGQVKSTGSTNDADVVATVTAVGRNDDGSPSDGEPFSVDVTRAMMRKVRDGKRGAPAVTDYVAASDSDDDYNVATRVETTGGKVWTYDYESDTWAGESAGKRALSAAEQRIADLEAKLAELTADRYAE